MEVPDRLVKIISIGPRDEGEWTDPTPKHPLRKVTYVIRTGVPGVTADNPWAFLDCSLAKARVLAAEAMRYWLARTQENVGKKLYPYLAHDKNTWLLMDEMGMEFAGTPDYNAIFYIRIERPRSELYLDQVNNTFALHGKEFRFNEESDPDALRH